VSDNLYRTNYLVDYAIKGDPLVSIMIHVNDNIQYIKKCINSIIRNEGENRYEILILVADRNEKQLILTLDPIKKSPNIKIITYESSLNASAINNFAAERASGDYLLFLSNEIEVATNNWLSYLVMNAQREDIGCVCPKILNLDGTVRQAGVILGVNGERCNVFSGNSENNWTNFGLDTWSRNYLAISGECLMINKKKFFQAGGFDENIKGYGSDIDLCLRVHKKGFWNLCIGSVCVYQFGACSRKEEISPTNLQRILKSYGSYLETGDPYYNPNLSLEENLCKIALSL
jgi:GT2 family glycosyltransferase